MTLTEAARYTTREVVSVAHAQDEQEGGVGVAFHELFGGSQSLSTVTYHRDAKQILVCIQSDEESREEMDRHLKDNGTIWWCVWALSQISLARSRQNQCDQIGGRAKTFRSGRLLVHSRRYFRDAPMLCVLHFEACRRYYRSTIIGW